MKQLKTISEYGFSQFDLSKKLLQNLNKFKLTPTAKLVLMFLADCYNPEKAYMFPKQKTIATKTGISEASVIRAVSELHKEGLIISERKYTRLYVFTSYFLTSLGISHNKMQVNNSQNEIKKTCNLQPVYKEQIKEQKNTTLVEDFKILKEYAIKKGARNINAYINTLKSNGSAESIIKEYKAEIKRKEYREKHSQNTQRHIEEIMNDPLNVPPTQAFKDLRRILYADN